MSVKANLEDIRARIARAAERSGRDPADVALCVVTKTVSLEKMKEAIACGIKIIGESRVNEAAEKQPQLGRSMQWHMVGHLQSRKAKQAVELFDMVQSVESLSTAEAIEKRCAETGRAMRILIEVNTSQEEQKYGVAPDEAALLVRRISPMEHLRIEGLMTMAAFVPDPEMARPSFIRLRQVAEHLEQEQIPGANFKILSMGMSNDFEVAIEEGSTMVRIGTAIFEDD